LAQSVDHSFFLGNCCTYLVACQPPPPAPKYGIADANNLQHTVKVYPNPATSDLTIDVAGSTNADVIILNIQGMTVGTAIAGSDGFYHYNVSKLPSGLYMVRINNEDKQQVLQFTKI